MSIEKEQEHLFKLYHIACIHIHKMHHTLDAVHEMTHDEVLNRLWLTIEGSHGGCAESLLLYYNAVKRFDSEALARDELYKPMDIDAPSTRMGRWLGYTPLCICVARSALYDVSSLLNSCGAGVNVPSVDGSSPLHFATLLCCVRNVSYEVMEVLLRHNADTSAVDADGQTALHRVCKGLGKQYRSLKFTLMSIKTILDHTVDKSTLVNILDSHNKSALDYAFQIYEPTQQDLEIFEVLVKHGANVNSDEGMLHKAVDSMQNTKGVYRFTDTAIPLYYRLIIFLLENGADPFKIHDGSSAMTIALHLKQGSYHACDNIISIFAAIQVAVVKLRDCNGRNCDIHIDNRQMGNIIYNIEHPPDRFYPLCTEWGQVIGYSSRMQHAH